MERRIKKVHITPKSKRYSLKTRVRGFDSHRWRVPDPMKLVENRPKFHGLDSGIYGAEPKYDGTRVFLIKSGNDVRIYGASRLKNEYTPRYPMLVRDGRHLKGNQLVLDAELVFFDKRTNNDIFITALATSDTISRYLIRLMCFDILFSDSHGGWAVKDLSFIERKKLLKSVIPLGLNHIKYVWWRKDRQKELYDTYVANGGEGVVIKNRRGNYQEGTRSPEWRKIKADDTDDAIVVGWTDGEGSRDGYFGALTTAQYHNGHLKFTGNVGGGFNNITLERITGLIRSIPSEVVSPFNLIDRRDAGRVHYIQPRLVIEVKFMQKTPSGKFRMPRFLRLRNDKSPDECLYNPTNV